MTIAEQFTHLKSRNEKALVLFLTAGDQPLADLPDICSLLVESGADLLEIGIPFSDPFGEGPVIQGSSFRSLKNGTTTEKVLESIARLKLQVPVVTMGYYNNALRFGLNEYAKRLSEVGASGSILSDLVPDEADDWCESCRLAKIDPIFLVAPTSTEERIHDACERTTGFVYAVSRMGVTGSERAAPPDVSNLISKVRAQTARPVCVGFGISTPDQVQRVCSVADGAVVGSALVTLLHDHWGGSEGDKTIRAMVRSWKEATRV